MQFLHYFNNTMKACNFCHFSTSCNSKLYEGFEFPDLHPLWSQ